jgi:hypothetical protein
VSLGYEPQWVLEKASSAAQQWNLLDVMRGMSNTDGNLLVPNSDAAESAVGGAYIVPTATGFTVANHAASRTYIYIAIRRGPMKVPTTGTSVFAPVFRLGTDTANTVVSAGSVTPDFVLNIPPNGVNIAPSQYMDRLRGFTRYLRSYDTNQEISYTRAVTALNNRTVIFGDGGDGSGANSSAYTYITYILGRAPGYFDVVCYTGTGSATTVAHNLAAVPELMIMKSRISSLTSWFVYSSALGATKSLFLEQTSGPNTSTIFWNDTTPTSTVFSLGSGAGANASGGTFVSYLFATCPGVSKVGSFTGTGATQVIDCGFTGGARFVLIKATSTTGDWMLWDSQRGIVAGNDPYLMLNNTSNQVTGTDWVDTASTGFELSNAGGNLANSNGVSYIFLAIA